MNEDELNEHIEKLKAQRLQLQNLRKISEDGLITLKQRMAEIEAELLKHSTADLSSGLSADESTEKADG